MQRLPSQHLDLYELAALASARTSPAAESCISDLERKELDKHLFLCSECQELLDQQQLFARMSIALPTHESPGATPGCPSEQTWMEIAAGLLAPVETQAYLDHAVSCARCAVLLKHAAQQFVDSPTDEERRLLEGLPSADPEWQRRVALRMHEISWHGLPRQALTKIRTRRPYLLQLGVAMAATVLLSALWWFAYGRPARVVNRLLAQAYSEQRTLDLRMAGARRIPLEAFRGDETSHLQRPTSLLEAEVVIAKELIARPDDPFWLDARARADLMDDNYASALLMLERAHQYAPGDQAILVDLASAFFLRAEELKRSEDYGRAVELLGQVLARNPGNEVARFNRAIAQERLLLYEQAAADWRRYLELDSRSAWSEEARQRLALLEKKIDLHNNHTQEPLLNPTEFVRLVHDENQPAMEEVSHHIERYFELALREWVSKAYSNAADGSAPAARQALASLSQVLIARHGDYWLADFLKELDGKRASQAGLPFLADFLRFDQTGDLDNAQKSALRAARSFQETGNRSGELLARFHASYADQLAHLLNNCLFEARAREDPRVEQKYPWLQGQFALESAACTTLNDESARRLADQALRLAKQHDYPSLELRASAFLAELYQYMGDSSSAWKYATDGLARYWKGDYPLMRGYSLYVEIDLIAEDTEQWFLDAQVLQEASAFIANDPDFELRAMEQHRLANALAMTGDFLAADETLKKADDLFLQSSDGTRKTNLKFEAEIGLAKIDLLRSHSEMAIARLEPLRQKVPGLADQDLIFDYFRNIGLAYFAAGKSLEARRDLRSALEFTEQSLRRNRNERERLIWCRKTDPVYRALVQLSLSGAAPDALAQWEWYKGASLRGTAMQNLGQGNELFLPAGVPSLPFAVPADTVVLSYAVLPKGTFAWTYTREGVSQYRLPISTLELTALARKFRDHCSRPDSALGTLAAESRLLYEKLIAPMEPVLRSYPHLLIEPDQALWLVPFDALLDNRSIYLGDRYAISLSPGLDYIAVAPHWQGISAESHILIAGDPETNGTKPLLDAEEEAKGIARQFRSTNLLLRSEAGYNRIAQQIKDAEIFHFSGHAAASPNGVALLLGDSGVMDVSRIEVSEFPRLRLAVLSACNSANGADTVFDDRDSLARFLVGAGVAEVVAARWMVDSRSAATIMPEFYAQLLSGKAVSLALHDAKQTLRGNKEFAHPFYWASFSAFGKS